MPSVVLRHALELEGAGRDQDCVRVLNALLNRADLNLELQVQARRCRAQVLLRQGRPRAAWVDFAWVLSAVPGDAWARIHQARLKGQFKERESALSELLILARSSPETALAWRAAEELERNSRRIGVRSEIFIGRAETDPSDEEVCLRAIRLLLRCGDVEAATKLLHLAITHAGGLVGRLLLASCLIADSSGDRVALGGMLDAVVPRTLEEAIWKSTKQLELGFAEDSIATLTGRMPSQADSEYGRWVVETVRLCLQLGVALPLVVEEVANARRLPDAAVRAIRASAGDWRGVVALGSAEIDGWEDRLLFAEGLRRCGMVELALEELQRVRLESGGGVPALSLNLLLAKRRVEAELVRAAVDGFRPTLPSTVCDALLDQQLDWLRRNGDDLLSRFGPGRNRVLVWFDRDSNLLVHRSPPDVRSAVAGLRGLIGDFGLTETIRCHDQLLMRNGEHPLIFTYRGELRMWLGDFEGAMSDLLRALALSEDTRWAWIGLAHLSTFTGSPGMALDYIERGTRLLGRLGSSPPAAAEAMMALGRMVEAERLLCVDLKRRPTRLSSWVLLAKLRFLAVRDGKPIVEAIASAYPELWSLTGGSSLERLDAILSLMGGNRSSELLTWFVPSTGWFATPAVALSEALI